MYLNNSYVKNSLVSLITLAALMSTTDPLIAMEEDDETENPQSSTSALRRDVQPEATEDLQALAREFVGKFATSEHSEFNAMVEHAEGCLKCDAKNGRQICSLAESLFTPELTPRQKMELLNLVMNHTNNREEIVAYGKRNGLVEALFAPEDVQASVGRAKKFIVNEPTGQTLLKVTLGIYRLGPQREALMNIAKTYGLFDPNDTSHTRTLPLLGLMEELGPFFEDVVKPTSILFPEGHPERYRAVEFLERVANLPTVDYRTEVCGLVKDLMRENTNPDHMRDYFTFVSPVKGLENGKRTRSLITDSMGYKEVGSVFAHVNACDDQSIPKAAALLVRKEMTLEQVLKLLKTIAKEKKNHDVLELCAQVKRMTAESTPTDDVVITTTFDDIVWLLESLASLDRQLLEHEEAKDFLASVPAGNRVEVINDLKKPQFPFSVFNSAKALFNESMSWETKLKVFNKCDEFHISEDAIRFAKPHLPVDFEEMKPHEFKGVFSFIKCIQNIDNKQRAEVFSQALSLFTPIMGYDEKATIIGTVDRLGSNRTPIVQATKSFISPDMICSQVKEILKTFQEKGNDFIEAVQCIIPPQLTPELRWKALSVLVNEGIKPDQIACARNFFNKDQTLEERFEIIEVVKGLGIKTSTATHASHLVTKDMLNPIRLKGLLRAVDQNMDVCQYLPNANQLKMTYHEVMELIREASLVFSEETMAVFEVLKQIQNQEKTHPTDIQPTDYLEVFKTVRNMTPEQRAPLNEKLAGSMEQCGMPSLKKTLSHFAEKK